MEPLKHVSKQLHDCIVQDYENVKKELLNGLRLAYRSMDANSPQGNSIRHLIRRHEKQAD